jgi:hypothetical protein
VTDIDHRDVAGRVATLEGRWKQTDARLEHLDSRVGSLSETMSVVLTKVDAVALGMDRITSRVNQPVNVWAVLSFAIGFVGLCIVIVGGVSGYVDLRLVPVVDEIGQNRESLSKTWGILRERSAVIGDFGARVEQLEEDFRHTDMLRHELEEDVAVLREKAAAAEVSRRAIGDYVRQVDELGSRHWITGATRASRVEE